MRWRWWPFRRVGPTVVGPQPPREPRRKVIVAEVHFDRQATPAQFRRLGESLAACQKRYDWIADVSCLAELLDGGCPTAYSKAIGHGDGTLTPLYDPVLVWGWIDYPGKKDIDPVARLREFIPVELGSVTYPDPDGGV